MSLMIFLLINVTLFNQVIGREFEKAKKEDKFCQNCMARPLGYLTGKRNAMRPVSYESRMDEIQSNSMPMDQLIKLYRTLVQAQDANQDIFNNYHNVD